MGEYHGSGTIMENFLVRMLTLIMAGCKGTKTVTTRPCGCPHGELYRRNGFLPLAEDSSDECDQCRGTGEVNAGTWHCSECRAEPWCPRTVRLLPDMSRNDTSRRRLVRKETASQRVMRRLLAGDEGDSPSPSRE